MATAQQSNSGARRPTQPPHASDRRHAVDPLWQFWARWESEKGKLLLFASSVILVLFVLLIGCVYVISQQQDRIVELSSERIMIGMPRQDGSFVSVDERPLELVKNFAATFTNNIYNYTPESIDANFNSATAMIDNRRRSGVLRQLDALRTEVKNQGLSQLYAREDHSISRRDNGFRYTTKGVVIEYGGQMEIDRRRVRITVDLVAKPPTKAEPLGVSILTLSERTI